MAQVELLGLKKLTRSLDKLAPRIQKNILRGAVRKVAADIRDNAKRSSPREFGTLEENIIAQSRRGRRGVVRASVIVRTEGRINVRDNARNAFYWRFQEFGYFLRDGTTFMPGTNFMTRAYESVIDRLDQILVRYMRPRIEREAKKL